MEFKRICRQCYIEKGYVVELVQKDGEWVCPLNPKHKTRWDDIQVV